MYSTPWCGYCHRLRAQMDREGISYEVVDIEAQPEAAEIVMSVNGGNQTVPTLVFPDGSALTNPSVAQVKANFVARRRLSRVRDAVAERTAGPGTGTAPSARRSAGRA